MSSIASIRQLLTQGQYRTALQQLAQLLPQDDFPSAEPQRDLYYLQAVAHRLLGEFDSARSAAETLIALDSQYARAQQELGYIYLGLAQPQAAATAFYRAVQLNPALLASWQALLQHYQTTGNHAATQLATAEIAYLKQLPTAILGARDLMYEGELLKADQVCRRFLKNHQHHPDALFLLAEIGIALKVYSEAEFLLETCLELKPQHAPAGLAYLQLLSKMGKFGRAKQLADTLLQRADSQQTAQLRAIQVAKATAMVGIGEVAAAIDIYRDLLAQDPAQAAVQLLLGHAQKALGDAAAATASYRAAYGIQPEFGDAWWSLANTKTYRFSEWELDSMQTQVSRPELATEHKVHFAFALGKAFEDRREFDTAFGFYAQGNQLQQGVLGYDASHIEKQVQDQIRHCPPHLFKRQPKPGDPSADPIFIVGLPRSGSTLLEQILASHTAVDGTMELHNILILVSQLRGQNNRYPAILAELDNDYWQRFGQQYLQDTQVYRQGAAHFIDKMPNNFLHLGLIKLILPNAKIIDARRHPMACGFSCFKQLFGEGQEFTYSLEALGRYYRAYLQMMDHWQQCFPGEILLVEHEAVVDDVATQVRRILAHCQLPFESACVDFHRTQRTIKTPSSEQVRQPIYRTGLAQWRHFEAHLQPLKQALQPRT